MWGSYSGFLDYLELRRRVEKHLLSPGWLLLHTTGFVVWVMSWLISYGNLFGSRTSFVSEPLAQFTMVWSVVLLLHALWTGLRSGVWAGARSRAIEAEMREMTRKNDEFYAQDERDLFRLHGLLDENIRSRANNVLPLLVFAVVNSVNWVASQGGYLTSYPWQITPGIAIVILLPVLIFNLWRSERQMRKLTQLMAPGEDVPKAKRDLMHLADDGELLEIIEEDEKPKPAFRG